MIGILTDISADLPNDVIERFGIEVIPLYINMGSEHFLDGVNLTKGEFYQRLPNFDPSPSTAAPERRMHIDIARFGELLHFKPFLTMNQGHSQAYRVRTRQKAIECLVSWMDEHGPLKHPAVVQASVQERAEALRDQAIKYLPSGEIIVQQITPVLGANLGVGALGFTGIAKEI